MQQRKKFEHPSPNDNKEIGLIKKNNEISKERHCDLLFLEHILIYMYLTGVFLSCKSGGQIPSFSLLQQVKGIHLPTWLPMRSSDILRDFHCKFKTSFEQ